MNGRNMRYMRADKDRLVTNPHMRDVMVRIHNMRIGETDGPYDRDF
jgi:hypothetical protein